MEAQAPGLDIWQEVTVCGGRCSSGVELASPSDIDCIGGLGSGRCIKELCASAVSFTSPTELVELWIGTANASGDSVPWNGS